MGELDEIFAQLGSGLHARTTLADQSSLACPTSRPFLVWAVGDGLRVHVVESFTRPEPVAYDVRHPEQHQFMSFEGPHTWQARIAAPSIHCGGVGHCWFDGCGRWGR